MLQTVDTRDHLGLSSYQELAHLIPAVHELRTEARRLVPRIGGRRVVMVNSTAQGGGVAEMLPRVIDLLQELGVDVRWLVIGSDRPAFFALTKRLHNLIHGVGDPSLGPAERELYDEVSRENSRELARELGPDDVLVIHDPQPLGTGALVERELGVQLVWRCHIGLDRTTPETDAAWDFLAPYADGIDCAVFSAPEYIPEYLAGRSRVLYPGIDPLTFKNRDLSPHKLQGVLVNGGLAQEHAPVLTPPFEHRARRLARDGSFEPADQGDEIGLLFRPTIVQISRWDRLKGFAPLLEGFVRLKRRRDDPDLSPLHRRRLELTRLVLAGPDPTSVADDPEALAVLDELVGRYREMPEQIARDVVLLVLPMESRRENALMVNALQRCASVVAQNSLEEGFGLTITEAMWKRKPVLGSKACGIRQQVRDGIDGLLVDDPLDPEQIAGTLDRLMEAPHQRELYASNAQRHVYEEFLIFTQLRRWLRLLAEVSDR